MAHVQNQVILADADIRGYLRSYVDRIQKKHPLGKRLPQDWPLESDLEKIVRRSGGQLIYASMVIRFIASSKHNPVERFQYILGISTNTNSGGGPLAELDALYRTLMSLVENLVAAIEILGIQLVRSSSQFWVPDIMNRTYDFDHHFRLLDANAVLAPLAPVLKYEGGRIRFYHVSFAEYLLDVTRSHRYFVQPAKWEKWIVAQLVPRFYNSPCKDLSSSFLDVDTLYLILHAKPGTNLHAAIYDGLALVANHPWCLPPGGNFNIWPLVTRSFTIQLQFCVPLKKMADIFVQRGQTFLPFPVLIKLAALTSIDNSFFLFETCRTVAELQKSGYMEELSFPVATHPDRLPILVTYLADYLDDQHHLGEQVLLPGDYLSALLRCMWYLWSSRRHIQSSLNQQLRLPDLQGLPNTLGVPKYLGSESSNLTRGALDALPFLLFHTTPSTTIISALKRPIQKEVLSKNPSSSRTALNSVHDYLIKHDPNYHQDEGPTMLSGQTEVEGKEQEDFVAFLHRKGDSLPFWLIA